MRDAPERIWFTKVGNDIVPNSERSRPEDVEYTRADLSPTREQVEAMVKPLEWEWYDPPSVWRARSAFGEYEVDTHGSWTLTRNGSIGRVCDGGKPAAQADYTARILSALTLPTPNPEEKP